MADRWAVAGPNGTLVYRICLFIGQHSKWDNQMDVITYTNEASIRLYCCLFLSAIARVIDIDKDKHSPIDSPKLFPHLAAKFLLMRRQSTSSSMPMKIYCREWQGNVHVFAILCGDRRPMTEGEKRTCCAQHWRVWENNSPRLCISNKVHLSRLCIWRERKLRIIVNFPFKFYLANALVLFFLLSFIVCSRCIYIWFCFFCARKIRNCIVFCIFLKVKLFIFLFIFVCAACVFWNSQYRLYRYNVDGQNNPIVWCFTCRAHSQACILLQLKEMQKHADKRRLWLGVARATFSGIVGPLQQWDGIRMIFRRCVLLMQRHPAIAIRLMIPRLVDIFSIPIHILIVDSQRNKTTY